MLRLIRITPFALLGVAAAMIPAAAVPQARPAAAAVTRTARPAAQAQPVPGPTRSGPATGAGTSTPAQIPPARGGGAGPAGVPSAAAGASGSPRAPRHQAVRSSAAPAAATTSPAPSSASRPQPAQSAATAVTAAQSASSGTGGACGPTIYKPDGTPWVCTFDDEFSGNALDTSKWTAWNDVNYNSNRTMCYYDDPSHVWVRGGYLNLAVTKLVDPAPCATPLGPLTPAYGGAVIHTKGTFSQTGGLFEARIKFGGGVGLHDDFWLWPENDYANYPGHAEIDIAEPYGAIPNSVPGATHVTNAAGADGGTVNWCSVPDWSGSFHTYGVSWSGGGTITFSVDGTTCFSFTNQSALAGYPPTAPFDQPFFMILQTLVDDGAFSPAPNASTVFPAVTQVDWVRVWK